MNAVKEAKGRVRFEAAEKLSTQVRAGQKSEIRGQRAGMEVNASLRSDSKDQPMIAARIELTFDSDGHRATLESQTELRPGELLVIGQRPGGQIHPRSRALLHRTRGALRKSFARAMSEPGITEAEWQTLYVRLERSLYNLAYRYVWQGQEAQDLVHDAFLQLWARRARVRPDTADRYLWVSVLNLSRKRRRWSRAKRFLYGDEELHAIEGAQSPESDAASSQERLLRAAIDRLPEKLRSVLLLTEFGEMGYEAIAELLSIPAGTVASRRHLAIKQLSLELKRDCHELT